MKIAGMRIAWEALSFDRAYPTNRERGAKNSRPVATTHAAKKTMRRDGEPSKAALAAVT
jgi:hypothetical protein